MRRLALLIALLTSAAQAQAPSPAQMGVTYGNPPATQPTLLQVLDATRTWVPLGYIDPVAHAFAPIGGSPGGPGGALPADPVNSVQLNGGGGLFASVPLGSSGQVLTANPSGPPTWQTPSTSSGSGVVNPPGAANQLGYYQDTTATISGLANGANGNVLTIVAGVPAWQAPSASSGIVAGTTPITGPCGANYLLYNNGSTVGCLNPPAGGSGAAGAIGSMQVSNGSSGFVAQPPYVLSVADSRVGMTPGTGASPFDNGAQVASLMGTAGTATGASQGFGVLFPPTIGSGTTAYYFGSPFAFNRQLNATCSSGTPTNPIMLAFPAGIDGVIFDNGSSSSYAGGDTGTSTGSRLTGCAVYSMGVGTGVVNSAAGTITSVGMPNVGPLTNNTVWAANDGIIVVNTNNAGSKATVGSTGSPAGGSSITLTLPVPAWIQPGMYLWDTATGMRAPVLPSGGSTGPANLPPIPFGTTVASVNTGTGVIGLQPAPGGVQMAQTFPTLVGSGVAAGDQISFANLNMLAVPEGTYISACTSCSSLTAASLTIAPQFTTTPYGPPLPDLLNTGSKSTLYRLPAAQRFTFTSTLGSNSITITGAPTGKVLQPGDKIWAPGFRFGTMVGTASGASGSQTVTLVDFSDYAASNATLATTGGYLWIVPDAVKFRTTAVVADVQTYGFPFGADLSCGHDKLTGGAYVPTKSACSNSVTERDNFQFGLIGRLVAGNQAGGNVSRDDSASNNYLYDFADVQSSVVPVSGVQTGGNYYNLKSHSAAGSQPAAMNAVVGSCLASVNYFGANVDVYETFYCLPNYITTPGPAIPSFSTILGLPPVDGLSGFLGGQTYCGSVGPPTGQSGACYPPGPGALAATAIFYNPSGGIPLTINGVTVLNWDGNMNFGTTVYGLGSYNYGPCVMMNGSPVPSDAFGVMSWNSQCGKDSGTIHIFEFNGAFRYWQTIMGHNKVDEWGYTGSNEETYPGYYAGGASGGFPMAPRGLIINNTGTNPRTLANMQADRLLDAGTTGQAITTNTALTVAAAGGASQTAIQVSGACPASPQAMLVIDASAGNADLGPVAHGGCTSTQAWLTLQSGAASANSGQNPLWSNGVSDKLTFGGTTTIASAGFWGVGDLQIPMANCTGVSNGQAVVNQYTGQSVGTVNTCATAPNTLLMSWPIGTAVAVGHNLVLTTRLGGDYRINTNPQAGGAAGWSTVMGSNGQVSPYPADRIAFDVNGIAWPAGGQTTIASLPTCPGSAPNVITGAQAIVTNGVAAPAYLSAVSTTGSSVRRVFCDGTGWLYD